MQFSVISTILLGLSSLAMSTPNVARREGNFVEGKANTTTQHLTTSSRMILKPTGQAGEQAGRKNATTIHPQIVTRTTTARALSAQSISTSIPVPLGTGVSGSRSLTTPVIIATGVRSTRQPAAATSPAGNVTQPEAQAKSNGTGSTTFKGAAAQIQGSISGTLSSGIMVGLFAVLFL